MKFVTGIWFNKQLQDTRLEKWIKVRLGHINGPLLCNHRAWQLFVLVEQTQCFHRLQDRLEPAQLRQKGQGDAPTRGRLVVVL